jgi:tellurite resistance protein TehA-like permease
METAGLSSICITYTTIIQMIALNLTSDWSAGWGKAAFVLWWTNAALALLLCIGTIYFIIKVEAPGVESIPPGILLPCIAALTAAAGGGIVCRYGDLDASLQVPVIIVSFLLIGLALPLAVVIHAVFLVRLFDKAFPVQQNVYQLMILCGPLGQGSFALQILGTVVQRGAFGDYGTSNFLGPEGGVVVGIASQFAGLLTWGYGVFWWGFACIAVANYAIRSPGELLAWKKSLASWGMVFPWVGPWSSLSDVSSSTDSC